MTKNQVAGILHKLDRDGFTPETVIGLRRSHPNVRLTVCSSDDMEEYNPFLEREAYRVFLLSNQGHCLSVTGQLESAVGLILAEA